MTDADRIETYTQFLRIKYADDVEGLRALVLELGEQAATSVVVTASGFEGEQSSGQLVLEPMARLKAAQDVLAELDPTGTPAERPNYTYARFRPVCRPASCE